MASAATSKYGEATSDEDRNFLAGKLQAARYFIRWELPEIQHQSQLLISLDQTCAEMHVDWF